MKASLFQRNWIRDRVHISWHIAFLSIGILLGAALSPAIGHSIGGVQWLVVAFGLALPAFINRRRYLLLMILTAGVIVGLCRAGGVGSEISQYHAFYGQQVEVSGRVNEDTSYGPKGDQRMRLDKISINGRQMRATVWVSFDELVEIKRGDIVVVTGLLSEGFGNTPASIFRAHIVTVERPNPGDVGRRARDWFGEGVRSAMPKDDANFALAFLLGQKLELPNNLGDQLRTIGLIHAIVASGYHLTVLVGVVRRLLTNVSKYLTMLLSATMIGGFILITGFSPSMTRAGLVSGLSLLAWYYGRRVHPIVLLCFAAALTVVYNPQYVWGDIGWYLSFASFAGVIVLAPLLNHFFWGEHRPGLLREILVITFAAQLATLPITIAVFGYYSVYALLANLLVVPLIPLIMLLTFVSGVAGLIFVPIASVVGTGVVWLLRYVTIVVETIVGLPSSRTDVIVGSSFVVISYLILAVIIGLLWRQTKHDFRDSEADTRLF